MTASTPIAGADKPHTCDGNNIYDECIYDKTNKKHCLKALELQSRQKNEIVKRLMQKNVGATVRSTD